MKIKKIAILGLGLIGGSLAKAIKRANPECFIIAMDRDTAALARALAEKTVDRITTQPGDAVADARLIFICTPVGAISTLMYQIKNHVRPETIVTDVGSTKKEIIEKAREIFSDDIYFIGGHPMAGTEHSGYKASMPHLFENAYYILTPLPGTPPEIVDVLIEVVLATGAIPLIMDASSHDRIVASISHLPHVVAASLVNTVGELKDPGGFRQKLAAGGFRDITRIASSSPEMWRDICLSNRHELLGLIRNMIKNLELFSGYLESEDANSIRDFFCGARDFRNGLADLQKPSLHSPSDVYLDVEDRPGVIGEVATLLGQHQVNIKNLRIIHSREGEPGCMVLTFDGAASAGRAFEILTSKGYRVYRY